MKLLKRQTPDIKFKHNTFEIGVGEIKPFNTSEELINEDRIRIGEMTKKMQHKRVLGAKGDKELYTFGILFAGHKIEYFVHEYKPHGPDQYTFRLIKDSTLPTLPSIFHNMTTS
jgi:hypothetical protein